MSPALMFSVWSALAIIAYAVCTIILFRKITQNSAGAKRLVMPLAMVAVVSHGLALGSEMITAAGINIGLGIAMSLVAWIVVVLYLVAILTQPVVSLGLVALPYAFIAVLLDWLWAPPMMLMDHLGTTALLHILIAIVAYGLLSFAFCQAILLLLQEWQLQNKHTGSFFRALPALDRMESILFQMISIGFILLTVTLLTGGLFTKELFGRPVVFNHHVVLSFIAWLSFGILLGGRILRGWRGRVAAIWTISSFALLVLAYFGTRFVLEIILAGN